MKNVETLIKEAMASTDSTQALKTWAARRGGAGGTTDAVHQALTEAGFTGSIQDQWDAFLDGAGYTGDLTQKLRLFWEAGGIQDYPRWLFTHGEEGAWYDPSDLSTLFQDAAGTVPVTADSQRVWRMLDKSGNGNHATAVSDAARPLYKTAGGLRWLEFDGVDDGFLTPPVDFTGGDQVSLFCGVNIDTANTYEPVVELNEYFTNNTFTVGVVSNAAYSGSFGTASVLTSAAIVYGTPYVISGLHEISIPLASIRRDGAVVQSLATTQGTGNYGNYTLNIGIRPSATRYLDGKIYGLIVRAAQSSAGEVDSAEAYMAAKSGVTL